MTPTHAHTEIRGKKRRRRRLQPPKKMKLDIYNFMVESKGKTTAKGDENKQREFA